MESNRGKVATRAQSGLTGVLHRAPAGTSNVDTIRSWTWRRRFRRKGWSASKPSQREPDHQKTGRKKKKKSVHNHINWLSPVYFCLLEAATPAPAGSLSEKSQEIHFLPGWKITKAFLMTGPLFLSSAGHKSTRLLIAKLCSSFFCLHHKQTRKVLVRWFH